MTTAVPEPVAPVAKLVPEPPLKQLTTAAVFRRLVASAAADCRQSCKEAITVEIDLSLFLSVTYMQFVN